ncbi:MAG: glutathione S-transferase family protein [Alphaproteobacteria bacterium]|nr:glutathione S-transferase family protein [Alphaproteobacteria bacterium]
MSYTLYSHKGSGGFIVEAALTLAGADFTVVEIDTRSGEQFSDEFRAINPWKQVPALQLPDGSIITESAAMTIHLASALPDAKLAPTPGTVEHAAFLRWIVFMTINIYESDLRVYYPARYTDEMKGREGVKRAGLDHFMRGLKTMEDLLESGPYILGEMFSIADIYLAMVYTWYPEESDLPRLQKLKEYVAKHPVIGPVWQRHFGSH